MGEICGRRPPRPQPLSPQGARGDKVDANIQRGARLSIDIIGEAVIAVSIDSESAHDRIGDLGTVQPSQQAPQGDVGRIFALLAHAHRDPGGSAGYFGPDRVDDMNTVP